jgi:hypothetical protein
LFSQGGWPSQIFNIHRCNLERSEGFGYSIESIFICHSALDAESIFEFFNLTNPLSFGKVVVKLLRGFLFAVVRALAVFFGDNRLKMGY